MKKSKIVKGIIDIFIENGINIEDRMVVTDIDSLVYMTIIVEIEQKFNIVLPDTVLSDNVFNDMDGFVNIIYQIVNGK